MEKHGELSIVHFMPTVLSINVSSGGIPKLPVNSCAVTLDGFAGDGRNHDKHISRERAVSLIDREILDQLTDEGYNVPWGAVGENITVENLNVQSLDPDDRLAFSGGVVIELVEGRRPCYVLDPLGIDLKKNIVGRCGYLARVITEGTISAGETIDVRKANA
jgi:MOSC domain-containing protein YiiM|tara:strand:- start:2 stop:487 length:486 start_codon:yes stop_codon:yes gene_type:complete